MKLIFQSRWLRVLIETLPQWPKIRRYRVVPAPMEDATYRLLRRRIERQVKNLNKGPAA